MFHLLLLVIFFKFCIKKKETNDADEIFRERERELFD
jgi:hypothetical protein